jgi:CopG family nickel-responsive transcriptional regulator
MRRADLPFKWANLLTRRLIPCQKYCSPPISVLRFLQFVIFVLLGAMSDDVSPQCLARLSVSLPAELLEQFESMVAERGLSSRSQMISELIRHELAEHSAGVARAVVAGTITLIYRAEQGRIRQALAQTQSDFLEEVISSQHVFLEEDQSIEVLLVQGPSERLAELCDRLRMIRGVHQITLVTTRALLPPLHAPVGGENFYSQDV